MILSDTDIKKALSKGHIVIKPKPDLTTQLGSCSLDLRLGNTFRVFDHSKYPYVDPFKKDVGEKITKEIKVTKSEPFIIQPSDFVLATTIEYVEIPDDLTGRLEGRSSIGRLGIVIHSTAAHIECGFRGNITLEIANMGKMPVALYPGMRICSISFEKLTSPAEVPYYKKKGAKYAFQKGPDESMIYRDELANRPAGKAGSK
jgi:dCTP deaminase